MSIKDREELSVYEMQDRSPASIGEGESIGDIENKLVKDSLEIKMRKLVGDGQ